MMKIKLGEIAAAVPAMNNLAQMKWPIKISYRIGKIVRQLNAEMEHYGQSREELIRKYGVETGERVEVTPENTKVFIDELKQLNEVEVELPIFSIKLSELGEVDLAPIDLVNAWFVFSDEASDAEKEQA
jgi:hypothetical protein